MPWVSANKLQAERKGYFARFDRPLGQQCCTHSPVNCQLLALSSIYKGIDEHRYAIKFCVCKDRHDLRRSVCVRNRGLNLALPILFSMSTDEQFKLSPSIHALLVATKLTVSIEKTSFKILVN